MRKCLDAVTVVGIMLLLVESVIPTPAAQAAEKTAIQFEHNDAQGEMWVRIEGEKAFCYQYGDDVDLPHFYPINSPAGQSMTVQQTEPYPHHRSFWFGDRISLEDQRAVGTYNPLYSGVKTTDKKSRATYVAPFKDGVRHVAFANEMSRGDAGQIDCKLIWFMDRNTPILDEYRNLRIKSLGNCEYFIDVTFTVTANYGDVHFRSDAVHYAWPYIRMNSEFAVPGGARIVGSEGPPTKARINDFAADWIDYSTTTNGKNAGLAMFSHNDNAKPHGWLVRDYGTFGPRRTEDKNGKPFTLAKGRSLKRRVGILVHRGDVNAGKVAQRYDEYNRGDL